MRSILHTFSEKIGTKSLNSIQINIEPKPRSSYIQLYGLIETIEFDFDSC